ncbi:MAG TPA: phage virion morphogenesis protein [Allosphingosinicella sp.]|jgi:phage virion morphogenesis protein
MSEGLVLEFVIEENLAEALSRGIAAGQDFSGPMKLIAVHLSGAAKLRFEREAGPDGTPWKKSRRAREEAGQTLTESGDLKNSIREDFGRDYAAAGPEASGGAAIYARIHQLGGIIVPKVKKALSFAGRLFARVVMPARPYMGFEADDPEFIVETLSNHLRNSITGGSSGAPA